MRGLKPDPGGCPFLISLQKAGGTQAPLVARFQAGETMLRLWGGQVVAQVFGQGQEFRRHGGADGVKAAVLGPSIATAIAEKPSARLGRARLEQLAEDIEGREFHVDSIAGRGPGV